MPAKSRPSATAKTSSKNTVKSKINTAPKAVKPEAEFTTQTIKWSPWLAVAFVLTLYYVSQYAAGIVVSLYPLLQHWSTAQTTTWLQNSVLGQFIYVALAESIVVAAVFGFLNYFKTSRLAIGLRRPKWSDLGWGLLVYPAYFVTYLVVATFVHNTVPAVNVNQSQQLGFNNVTGFGPLLAVFISLVVLPPITEEILVRGYLYSSLRKGLPLVGAALSTSLIFAAAHLQPGMGKPLLWIAAIDTFILSLFLIFLREKTGGLWASVTLHTTKNLVAFASLFIVHLA